MENLCQSELSRLSSSPQKKKHIQSMCYTHTFVVSYPILKQRHFKSFLTILILGYCIFSFSNFILVNWKHIVRWRGYIIVLLTFFCMTLSSSLKLMFTFINCWIFTSEATNAFLTCIYSWAVTGPSDKSESRLYKQ